MRVDHPQGQLSKFAAACAVAPETSQRAFTLGQISNPYPPHYRTAFAFCFFLYPLHHGRRLRFGCHAVLAVAMHRAYLVSQGAHLAGEPDDGVRDVLSAARTKGTN